MRLTGGDLLASSAGLREAWLGSQLRRWLGVDPPALEWASEAIGRGPVSSEATDREFQPCSEGRISRTCGSGLGFLVSPAKNP